MSTHPARTGVVAVEPVGGLCNRLLVISSFGVLARQTGRGFRVFWGPSPGFSDEDLSDLFENEVPRITEVDFDRLGARALRLHEAVAISGVGPERRWRWAPGANMGDVLDASACPVVVYVGQRRLESVVGPTAAMRLPESYARDRVRALRAWRPTASIREAVECVAASFDAHTVGVHVRRGDALAHPRLAPQFRQSTEPAFFARMDQILRRAPETRFFLATDGAETDDRFRDRYGDVLVTNPSKQFVRSAPGEPKANQRDAVIDLFLLARTRRILGTSYSTFSITAAEIGDVPLEVVLDRTWRYRARAKAAWTARKLRSRAGALVERVARRDHPDD